MTSIPDDRGRDDLWNVGLLLGIYNADCPRRLHHLVGVNVSSFRILVLLKYIFRKYNFFLSQKENFRNLNSVVKVALNWITQITFSFKGKTCQPKRIAKVLTMNVFKFLAEYSACKTITVIHKRNKMPYVHAEVKISGIWIANSLNASSALPVCELTKSE
jgi:hypothetical protein